MRFPVACLGFILLTLSAGALRATTPGITASNAWVRAVPGAAVAAAYLTLRNGSSTPVTVLSVSCPLAGMAMIHETRVEGGQSRMRLRASVRVAPGATVAFAPGGVHVMLQQLRAPLHPGEEVPLLLQLEGGDTLSVTARVRPLGAE